MNEFLKHFKLLNFFLLFFLTVESYCQSDSLTFNQSIDKAEAMLEMDFPKAMATCIELNRLASSTSCLQCKGKALIMLGKAYWVNGQYKESVNFLKQGIKIAKQSNDIRQWAKAANSIGNNFYYQAYYDSAIFYFKESLSAYEKINDQAGMAYVMGDISLMYNRKGDYTKSIDYLIKGEEINRELAGTTRQLGNFPGMGNLFPDSLYFREKISDNLLDLNVQLKNNNDEAVYKIYLSLGSAHNQVKEYVVAARYYLKAFAIQEKLGLLPLWFYAGMNYMQANMKDSCFFYIQRAKQDFKRTTQLHILYIYELLGDAHLHFEQYDSALHNYASAMRMNTGCNNRITVAGIHRRLVDVNAKMGRFAQAEEHLQKGLVLAKEVSMAHRRNLYKSAADLYKLTGNYRKALDFQSQYILLSDSLGKQETTQNLTRVLAQFKTAKKERELELLKVEKEKGALVLENKNVTIISLVVVALASFVFIFVFARQRNGIKKKNNALNIANKLQETLMKEVHHRVKNNLQLIASLINLQVTKIINPEVVQELEKTRSRIMSIALIHQKLYQHDDMNSIDLKNFLENLIENLLSTLTTEMKIEQKMDIASVKVEIETAISIGLIVNELVTNSLKHGLVHTILPQLAVQLTFSNRKITLIVHDNGAGNLNQSESESERGFGLRLIEILLKSVSGTIETNFQNGMHTRIEMAHQITT